MSHPLPDMMSATLEKVKQLIDANTVVGSPISTPDGATIIPISKITMSYAGGGSDFANSKKAAGEDNLFGGGLGASVKVTPIAFLIIRTDSVRVLPIAEAASTTLDRLVDMIPEAVDKVQSLLTKKKEEEL